MIFLCSCVGVSADIAVNSDNSGTITLEYRISSLLESLGKQDGNERWLPVPVGKADIERSIQRLPGIKMLSFSQGKDGKGLINTVKLEFKSMEALVNFLDPRGGMAVYEKSPAGENSLSFNLEGIKKRNDAADSAFFDFYKTISEGYVFSIKLNLEAEGTLDSPSIQGAAITSKGKKLIFSSPMSAVLNYEGPFSLNFRW
jgi:hypothetical protein